MPVHESIEKQGSHMMRFTWIPHPLHRHAIPATRQQLKQRRRLSKALLLRMRRRFSLEFVIFDYFDFISA
jgi:hypothetical protein